MKSCSNPISLAASLTRRMKFCAVRWTSALADAEGEAQKALRRRTGFLVSFWGSLWMGWWVLAGLERGQLTDAVAVGGRRAEGVGAF